ncbi:hypothetical protein F53441_9811 [Fusarium austroafricanum]|uniref:Uncharacterized protein n=1 Tax=Fusarium austroafricanum TaxID=2364996 RepID=A0A8H4KB20_9HYPO|nr:hypothetical protein F53441_9811 [Fusarium austroafricanum]
MDVTASTINRTSPLDLDFAKIKPFIKSGVFLEPPDATVHAPSESRAASPVASNGRSTLEFSSNAGIIDQYSRSWNIQEPPTGNPHNDSLQFERLIGPTSGHTTPRWPFINDDSLNTPDSVDNEPLFPPSQTTSTKPRKCHQIDEELEELTALYVPPLDSVPEVVEVEAPPRRPPVSSHPNRGKVMTAAEFEALQKRKAREEAKKRFYGGEDEDDKLDYDNLEEVEVQDTTKAQRKKQQAYLNGYRQRMMKTTKGAYIPPLPSHSRVSSSWSMKSFKAFQGQPEDIPERYEEDNDEDDVPLALLQMQRRSDGKELSNHFGSARLEPFAPPQPQPTNSLRHQGSRSPMPAFARSLPQDPFPSNSNNAWPLSNQQLVPGGLIGVIANEERAKARRRALPSHGFQPIPDTNNAFTWTSGPHHSRQSHQPPTIPMSYGMNGMQTPMHYSRTQTPVAMPQMPAPPPNNQMFNFLQAQTEFFRTMATINQQRNAQPWENFSARQPVMNMSAHGAGSTYAPSNYAPSNYAPSNYAPSNYARSNYARSVYQNSAGYAGSVAPSERNNVGLPSRYRPVSKTTSQIPSGRADLADDAASLNNWDSNRNRVVNRGAVYEADSTDDDDDEAFWRAKKAKRDRRRAMWIQGNDLGIQPEWIRQD